MPVTFTSSGDFSNTDRFLNKMKVLDISGILKGIAQQGVEALKAATPTATGETSELWGYEVAKTGSGWTITWTNSHMVEGVNIAILLEYGHGTGTGGYVQGRDYINPAIRPIFDQIAAGAWKAVTSA